MPAQETLANAIRILSMDAIERAKSGHPGAPLGMADIAAVLWRNHFKHNPANPCWPDRDRFVLSNGHGSMLLYALLHLTGYDLSIEDIRNFRQLHSRTPGHPECGVTPGVETTTGPLGQGLANAVGMALAERTLAATFNRPGHTIVDHFTYVFLGDGCMMEGVSHEACSLAGTLGLGKLIALYDDNGISIDGHVVNWFDEDTPGRFRAYGWHVVSDVNGHDPAAVDAAIRQAKSVNDKPSLICCKTVIGYGAPNVCGSHDCHGAPLGADEIAAARANLNWSHAPFELPDEVRRAWDMRATGQAAEADWKRRFAAYSAEHPDMAREFERRVSGALPEDFRTRAEAIVRAVDAAGPTIATRKASQNAIEAFGPLVPEMFGGSADLTSSNLTNWTGSRPINRTIRDGNYLSYGVREFAMAAMENGMALHGGFIPYGGTFLVFSDYSRNAIRMAALMNLRVIHVLTHDSIGVGEDGPTHQPIEHVSSLRMIPNMRAWRPCDAVETAVAWKSALERVNGPTALILSRQNLPHQARSEETLREVERGGYVLRDAGERGADPDVILMATGSEVGLAMAAADILAGEGVAVRVVSMPCMEAFLAQDAAYREKVIGNLSNGRAARVAVEAGVSMPWRQFVGPRGEIVAMDRFGESAPGGTLFKTFGFTVENVADAVRRARARALNLAETF